MKLKCIGGKCDGLIWKIPDHPRYREGDCVQVPNYPTTISEMEFTPTSSIAVQHEIYKIDVLKYSNGKGKEIDEIWFLRPTNFTTFDAIKFQFLK